MSASYSFAGSNCRIKLTRAATDWYVSNYIGDRYKFAIDFVSRGMIREGNFGACCIMDSCSRPREFLIEMHNRLDVDTYLRTLFHELIHVKQRIKREHVTKYDKNYWYSRIVPEGTAYEDEPWEIEAHGDEERIYQEFMAWQGE